MTTALRTKIDLIVLAIVLAVGAVAANNAHTIGDYANLLTYKPSVEVRRLADDAGMSDKGKRMFYRYSPELAGKQRIEEVCGPRIGCVEGRSIYILRGTTNAEYNTAVVTAAHEMLHVAYSRLDDTSRSEINSLVLKSLENPENRTIAGKIFIYKKRPDRYVNEAHSYLATESNAIGPELVSHYAQYFSDRAKVVTAHTSSSER